jgi:orotidine-5'-phosphate decarboxylase
MPIITPAEANAHLQKWLTADLALANGQAYTINGRSITRAETRENIVFWNDMVATAEKTTRKRKVRGIVPI